MLIISVVFSFFVLGMFYVLNREPRTFSNWPTSLGMIIVSVPVCSCGMFLPGYLSSLALGIAGALLWNFVPLRRSLGLPILLLSVFLGHFVIYLVMVAPDLRQQREIRDSLTVLDLAERLRLPAQPIFGDMPLPEVQPTLDFDIQEAREDGLRKTIYFQWLHQSQFQSFINSPGFGVMRLTLPRKEQRFYTPRREPILQPSHSDTSRSHLGIEHPITSPIEYPVKYHHHVLTHFSFPIGWGWERKPGEFLGFMEHQMGMRNPDESQNTYFDPLTSLSKWKLASIELIGLLVHDKTVVYMTENLPRMDEAKTAPKRDPDEFETAGLKAIASGKELYFGRSRDEPILRMIGGIRAVKSCISCHECRNGELLGAFSYTFHGR